MSNTFELAVETYAQVQKITAVTMREFEIRFRDECVAGGTINKRGALRAVYFFVATGTVTEKGHRALANSIDRYFGEHDKVYASAFYADVMHGWMVERGLTPMFHIED